MPPMWLPEEAKGSSIWITLRDSQQTDCRTAMLRSNTHYNQLLLLPSTFVTSKQNHFRADNEILLTVIAFPVLRHLILDSKASIQEGKKNRALHNNFKKQIYIFFTFFQWLSKADAKIPSFFQRGLELTFFLPQGYGKTEKRYRIWLMSGKEHNTNSCLDTGGFSCRMSYNNQTRAVGTISASRTLVQQGHNGSRS